MSQKHFPYFFSLILISPKIRSKIVTQYVSDVPCDGGAAVHLGRYEKATRQDHNCCMGHLKDLKIVPPFVTVLASIDECRRITMIPDTSCRTGTQYPVTR